MSKILLSQIQKILICEDHSFIQKGLKTALMEFLPNASSFEILNLGEQAIEASKKSWIDIAFIDLNLPDISGVDVVRSIKKQKSQFPIFVITSLDNPSVLNEVLKLKVDAIIHKSSSDEHLKRALQNLESDKRNIYLDESIQKIMDEHHEIYLTVKEKEVLHEIAQGLPNQKIADKLGCALTTVRFHRANIMDKTGLRNAAELTAWYLKGQC